MTREEQIKTIIEVLDNELYEPACELCAYENKINTTLCDLCKIALDNFLLSDKAARAIAEKIMNELENAATSSTRSE